MQNKLIGNQLGGDIFMKLIIDEWLSIQAITLSKIYGKTFLLPNVNDECNKYSIVNCKTNKICDTYTNSKRETKCVSKHLIQKFEKNVTIFGTNNKEYTIIEAEILSGCTSIQCYYYFVASKETNNIYILFNDGIVLPYVELYDEDMYEEFEYIIDIMKKYLEPYSDNDLHASSKNKPCIKFILCGHSMGNTLA